MSTAAEMYGCSEDPCAWHGKVGESVVAEKRDARMELHRQIDQLDDLKDLRFLVKVVNQLRTLRGLFTI